MKIGYKNFERLAGMCAGIFLLVVLFLIIDHNLALSPTIVEDLNAGIVKISTFRIGRGKELRKEGDAWLREHPEWRETKRKLSWRKQKLTLYLQKEGEQPPVADKKVFEKLKFWKR